MQKTRFRMLFIKPLGQHERKSPTLRKGAYIAAINRAKGVLEQYEQTPSTPYALALLWNSSSQDSYRVTVNFADKHKTRKSSTIKATMRKTQSGRFFQAKPKILKK